MALINLTDVLYKEEIWTHKETLGACGYRGMTM